jgi:hypothetical protein
MEINKISGVKIKLRGITVSGNCGFSFNLPSFIPYKFSGRR